MTRNNTKEIDRATLNCPTCGIEIIVLRTTIELKNGGGIYCADCGEPLAKESVSTE